MEGKYYGFKKLEWFFYVIFIAACYLIFIYSNWNLIAENYQNKLNTKTEKNGGK